MVLINRNEVNIADYTRVHIPVRNVLREIRMLPFPVEPAYLKGESMKTS